MTDPLQRIFKEFQGGDGGQVRTAAIATEGDEVELAGLLIKDALAFHAPREYSTVNPAAVIRTSPVTKSEGPGAPAIASYVVMGGGMSLYPA